jgi:hypothetical protein
MSDENKADKFELLTALLLGFAALGAAIASLQGGQWGGKQLEAFSQSNSMQTLAARDYNEAVSSMNADYATIASAKMRLIDAADAVTEVEEQRNLRVVSYLYSQQLTWQAMKALGMSEALWSAERAEETAEAEAPEGGAAAAPAADDDAADDAPAAAPAPTPAPAAADDDDEEEGDDDHAPTAAAETPEPAEGAAEAAAAPAAAEAEGSESAGETALDTALGNMLDEDFLWGTIEVELHDEDSSYGDDLFSEPMAAFERADAKFHEGETANENGDQYDLAGVFYTVALFFAGLGLVFKSAVRWPFFGLGMLVFLGTVGFMMTLPWAS